MSLLAFGGSSTFEKCPAGMHHAVCSDVKDLGIQVDEKFLDEKGNPVKKHKVQFEWQTETEMTDGRRYMVRRVFTLSLHEKAALRKFLEAWRGVAFTREDLAAGFDVTKLKGVNCTLQIIHTEDGKWANVQGIMPPTKGAPQLDPIKYPETTTSGFDNAFTGSAKKGIDLSNVEPAF